MFKVPLVLGLDSEVGKDISVFRGDVVSLNWVAESLDIVREGRVGLGANSGLNGGKEEEERDKKADAMIH